MSLRTKAIQIFIEINENLIFYPALRKFYLRHLNKNSLCVIDVGSNKGQSIDFFKKISSKAKIFGFEPNKKLYDKLRIKYAQNPEIVLYNVGISSKEGVLMFNENILDETSSFENLNFDSQYLKNKARILGVSENGLIACSYEVETMTLSSFLDKYDALFFDVLKIDIEGHELHSLKGLFTEGRTTYPIRFIQMESHNDDMYLSNSNGAEVEELLKKHGFNEVARFKHGFGDFYEIIYENKNIKGL